MSNSVFPKWENTDQESSSNETEPEDTNDSSDEELHRYFDSALAISEKQNGEWLPHNPWNSDNKPDPNLKMKDTVAMSSIYPLSFVWMKKQTPSQLYVDPVEIFSSLPRFMQCEMQGSINGSRQELEELVYRDMFGRSPVRELNPSDLLPHTREIVDRINEDHGNDKRSSPSVRHLKAISIQYVSGVDPTIPEHTFYFDCEYILKMYASISLLPVLLTWFDVQQCDHGRGPIQWIRKIKKYKKRWIFIPSFRRAQMALLEWPQDDIVTQESTIRILVVRPSEFREYVMNCGHKFPVICLPQDEIGAGYPRYWIHKIALRLKLQFIWMIDDSVEGFYEYAPPPCNNEEFGFGRRLRDKGDYKPRKFGLVFERIENLVKATKDEHLPIAAMSPRRYTKGGTNPSLPFDCKPPQIAVFLNLAALKSKEVYYRPELQVLEDMIFGYECEKNGLKVFIDNRIHVQDRDWKDTGAMSPSVKQKPT